MMSPFTFTTTRSMTSPWEASPSRTRLRMALRFESGFMVHLGPGQEVPDEFVDGLIGLLPHQGVVDLAPAVVEGPFPGRNPGIDLEDMEAHGCLDDLGRPGDEGEGCVLEGRGELPPGKGPHETPFGTLGGLGLGAGEGGEGG